MNEVATLSPRDRADMFNEAAAKSGFPASILEKDFWVCWSLKRLFAIEELQGHLVFKGGTSLSKVFKAIHRFSEDVDLALGWSLIGMHEDEPGAGLTKTRQGKLWKAMETDCRAYIAGPLRGLVKQQFAAILDDTVAWDVSVDPDRPDNLNFEYPMSGTPLVAYLKSPVVLELGTQAAFTPSAFHSIEPMVASELPALFADPSCPVRAIDAERTFWEKATILHREFHRAPGKAMDVGYSRHYYDVAMLASNERIRAAVLESSDLLAEVVAHKRLFYPQSWAKYETAVPGSLRLMPSPTRMEPLKTDYAAMQVMMYPNADPPSFDQIVETLRLLEDELNG